MFRKMGRLLAAADLLFLELVQTQCWNCSLKKVYVFSSQEEYLVIRLRTSFVSDNNFGCVLQEEELTVDLLNGITKTFSNRETHQRALAEFRPKDSSALIYKEIVELG